MLRIDAVEDDAELMDLLGELFQDQGWELLPLPKSELAVASIEREQPDLVLVDVRLDAGLSGWDILDRLKMEPATRSIPLIVWSGDEKALDDKKAELLDQRVAVLQKPFDIDDLCDTIEEVMVAQRPRRA